RPPSDTLAMTPVERQLPVHLYSCQSRRCTSGVSMRASGWVAVVLSLGAVVTLVHRTQAQAPDNSVRLQRLAARLGSHNFHERELASGGRDERGESAGDALRQATGADTAEPRRRASELIEKIARRSATARILAPTFVTLNYEKTPLTQAVADLARRT